MKLLNTLKVKKPRKKPKERKVLGTITDFNEHVKKEMAKVSLTIHLILFYRLNPSQKNSSPEKQIDGINREK